MGFREIENDIKSGAANRAAPILLCGEERFLTDHYERRLVALFSGAAEGEPAQTNDLDLCVFYGDEADDETIMGAADTFPMLMPARIVVVRNHTAFRTKKSADDSEPAPKTKNALADYLSEIPETTRLIFSADKANKTRALYKAIANHGTVYEFERLDKNDLGAFIRTRFKTYGVTASENAMDAFIYASGYLEKDSDRDLFTVEGDAYKLASFALGEGRTAITNSDIEICLADMLRTDIFAMLDAISSNKKAAAITLLENSLAEGENVFRLLALFTGHFEIMLGYKELSAEGHSAAQITKLLGEKSDWRVKKLGGFAERFETNKLRQILLSLYETEHNIKSGNIKDRHALTTLLAGI